MMSETTEDIVKTIRQLQREALQVASENMLQAEQLIEYAELVIDEIERIIKNANAQ